MKTIYLTSENIKSLCENKDKVIYPRKRNMIIPDGKIKLLMEAREEITFFAFKSHVRNFLLRLLENPVDAKADKELREYFGCDDRHILEKLIDYDIVRRDSKLKETPKEATADGKSKVALSVKYSVPRADFNTKLHKIYDNEILGKNKENVNEALDKYYGNYLKKYLVQSKTDDDFNINVYIEYECNYCKFYDYITSEGLEDEFTENELEEIELCCEDCDDVLLDEIENGRYSKYKEDFYKYLKSVNRYGYLPTSEVMYYLDDVNNEWLIHFSDNAYDIWREGFKYATSDVDALGYSGAGSTANKESEGYDFAFRTDRNISNYFSNYNRRYNGAPYGKEAVMFRASGVEASHSGDEQDQVMFYNMDAKDIVYLQWDEYRDWFVADNKGRAIYRNENIDEVINWVKANFNQYRKQLVNPKEHKNIRMANAKSSYQYNYNNK